MATGILKQAGEWIVDVKLLTIEAIKRPIVMASWYAQTKAPRIHLGAISDWYKGTSTDIVPTPMPATNLADVSLVNHTAIAPRCVPARSE